MSHLILYLNNAEDFSLLVNDSKTIETRPKTVVQRMLKAGVKLGDSVSFVYAGLLYIYGTLTSIKDYPNDSEWRHDFEKHWQGGALPDRPMCGLCLTHEYPEVKRILPAHGRVWKDAPVYNKRQGWLLLESQTA